MGFNICWAYYAGRRFREPVVREVDEDGHVTQGDEVARSRTRSPDRQAPGPPRRNRPNRSRGPRGRQGNTA